MNCEHIRELLGPYLDGELGADERKAVDAHVAVCLSCAQELADLRMVNATGTMKFFPEPPHDYWKNLTQSVMGQIRELDPAPVKSRTWVATIKSILWPQQIRFRLVSLAASAAVVGVFVLLTFFREGTMQLPPVSSLEENVNEASGGAGIADSAALATSNRLADSPLQRDDVKTTMTTALEKEMASSDLNGAEGKGAALPIGRATPTPVQDAVSAFSVDEMKVSLEVERESSIVASKSLPKVDSARIPLGFTNEPKATMTRRHEARDKLALDALRSKSAPDEAAIETPEMEFERALVQAQQTSDPAQKLYIWERFLKRTSDLAYQKKAIREMLPLHFERAMKSDDKAIVQQSIAFFEAHRDLFRHENDFESLEQMLKHQQQRLEELQKK